MSSVNFSEILSGGFNTWKNNLGICIPFILGMVISLFVAATILLIALFSIFMPIIETLFTNPSSITSTEFFSQIFRTVFENLWIIIVASVITAVIAGLINAFFTSGAIGMAKEAILTGRTNLSHMVDYGKRKYLSLFAANIIVGLIASVGFLFLIPGILSLYSIATDPSVSISGYGIFAVFTLLIGLIPMAVYMLAMSILLALVSYAVVLDDLKAIEGFKKGVRVVWHNKINVFLIWLIVLVVGIVAGLIGNIPFVGWILSLIVSLVIVSPLTAIWWSKLYLGISKA